MKKFFTLSFILAGLLFINPINAHACSGHNKSSQEQTKADKLKKEVKMLWIHAEVLNLSEDQKTKIMDIKHDALKKLIQQQADLDIIKVDYKASTKAMKLDVGKINKLLDKKYDAKKKIAKTYIKAKSDIQNTLTDAQLKTWHDAKSKMMYHSKCGDCQDGEKCAKCASKSKCADCKDGKKCAKCAAKKDGICPITGKPLESVKGSMKDSEKGSMKE